jgi:hypothetical protein
MAKPVAGAGRSNEHDGRQDEPMLRKKDASTKRTKNHEAHEEGFWALRARVRTGSVTEPAAAPRLGERGPRGAKGEQVHQPK